MSLSAASPQFLNTSRDSDSTNSLGCLFQHLTTLLEKKLFLISNLNVFTLFRCCQIHDRNVCFFLFLFRSKSYAAKRILLKLHSSIPKNGMVKVTCDTNFRRFRSFQVNMMFLTCPIATSLSRIFMGCQNFVQTQSPGRSGDGV